MKEYPKLKALSKMKNEMTLTRSQIRANREKWARFLMKPGRKKYGGALDNGGGARCCLGHGAYALGVSRVKKLAGWFAYGEDQENNCAPEEFVDLVGLYTDNGRVDNLGECLDGWDHESLVEVNDNTDATPQEIGKYLLSVIDGGPHTPFRPLSDYPKQLETRP